MVTVTGTTAEDKNYDGNTTATLNVGTLSGLVGNETLGLSAAGIFDSALPGQRKASVSYTLADGSNGGVASNYAIAGETGLTAQIRPMTAVETARGVAQQALTLALAQASTSATSTATTATATPNVVALPGMLSTKFSLENPLDTALCAACRRA